jgi:hypothetical protein
MCFQMKLVIATLWLAAHVSVEAALAAAAMTSLAPDGAVGEETAAEIRSAAARRRGRGAGGGRRRGGAGDGDGDNDSDGDGDDGGDSLEEAGALHIPTPTNTTTSSSSSSSTWRRLCKSPVPFELCVGVGLQVYQQLSGINTVMYYSTSILLDAGFGRDDAMLAVLPVAACNVLGSAVGCVLIDKVGRRPLLLASAAAVSASLVVLGAALASGRRQLAVVALMAYMLSFAPGLSPVPWAVNSEIYPSSVRGAAGGIATTGNWVANIVVSQTFLSLVRAAGPAATFNAYAAVALGGALVAWRCVPETKGLTMAQVQAAFKAADPFQKAVLAGR